jgi:DNA-binding NtrC family response regulator
VLLVEDEESVRAGLTELLKSIGYDVMAVGSGEQAIAIPVEPVPDFLLSDITLPGIGGPDLGVVLSKRWPGLRIVLMSGYLADDSRIPARRRGWHFLQKPFELANLADALALAT